LLLRKLNPFDGKETPVFAEYLKLWDMKNVLKKAEEAGNHNIMLTERGASFGYNALVTDMRSLAIMRDHMRHILALTSGSLSLTAWNLNAMSSIHHYRIPQLTHNCQAVWTS